MRRNWQVLEGANNPLVLLELNMLARLRVKVSLTKAEINEVDHIRFFALANANVLRFHVSVDEMEWVEEFQPYQDLMPDFTDDAYRKATVAELEQLPKVRAKNVHYEAVEVTFNPKVLNLRDSN